MTKQIHEDTYPAIDSVNVNLKGKAVFVCGGSKNIGKATVLSFARAGVSYLAVGARSDVSGLKKEIQDAAAEGGRAMPQFLPVTLDAASPQSVAEAAEKVEKAFGKLDIVINVMGSLGERNKIGDSDPEKWWDTISINLRAPYLTCRAFLPLLLKGESKTIINVSSVGAHCVSPTLNPYQMSKLAVLRLSEFLSAEYAEEGLICFSIHPGNVPTDILGPDGPPEGMEHIFVETVRLPADTMVFLTSERREWLAGRYVNCTWDMTELMAQEERIMKGDLLKVKLAL